MKDYIIQTKRLGLRNWTQHDVLPFANMCADERVMKYFPSTLSKEQTTMLINKMQNHFKEYGYCYFAVDRLDTKDFIGFIGLLNQTYESDFTPCIDIGWRLASHAWGNGFATEGAKACLFYAFNTLKLNEVYAVAPILNKKSQKVMQNIGMHYHLEFVHPKITKSDPLSKCVVYRATEVDL